MGIREVTWIPLQESAQCGKRRKGSWAAQQGDGAVKRLPTVKWAENGKAVIGFSNSDLQVAQLKFTAWSSHIESSLYVSIAPWSCGDLSLLRTSSLGSQELSWLWNHFWDLALKHMIAAWSSECRRWLVVISCLYYCSCVQQTQCVNSMGNLPSSQKGWKFKLYWEDAGSWTLKPGFPTLSKQTFDQSFHFPEPNLLQDIRKHHLNFILIIWEIKHNESCQEQC